MSLIRICLFLLVLVKPSYTHCQIESLHIRSINGKSISTGINKSDSKVAISGTWNEKKDRTEAFLVQLAVKKPGSDGWFVFEPNYNMQGKKTWNNPSIDISNFQDEDRIVEIIALAVEKGKPLAYGLIPQKLLPYNVLIQSNPIRIELTSKKEEDKIKPTPFIRIDRIGNNIITSEDSIVYVKLEEILQGEVQKEKNHQIQVVVQPLKGPDRWVMDRSPTAPGRKWQSMAFFGRRGWDEFHEFSTYAIITKNPLPINRGITPSEWEKYKESQVISISPEIVVIRIEEIKPITVVINSIGQQRADPGKVLSVNQSENIKGQVVSSEDRPLKSTEKIYLFSISENKDVPEKFLGVASLQGKNTWELPPNILGNSGEARKIVAVLSETNLFSLKDIEGKRNKIISDPISVAIDEIPPIDINITLIDNQLVTSLDTMRISKICDFRGKIVNRLSNDPFDIWIYTYSSKKDKNWKLHIGPIPVESNNTWSIAPTNIGNVGDVVLLMAVISPRGTKPKLSSGQGDSNIKAYSKKVLAKLQGF